MAENIKIPQFAINGQIYDILDKKTSEDLAQLSSYVGTPDNGKTIVQMISDGDVATLNSAKSYINSYIGDLGSSSTVASALNALNSEITGTINPQITTLNNKIGQIGSTSVAEALNTLNTQITNDITSNINTVIDKVKFNEKVTAVAMTDLHRQIQDIEENVNYIIKNGISTTSGGSSSGSTWDGLTHYLYYKVSSTEIDINNIDISGFTPIPDTSNNGKYSRSILANEKNIYIIYESNKSFKAISANNETLTSNFVEIGTLTINANDVKTYKVRHYHSNLPLDINITITIS